MSTSTNINNKFFEGAYKHAWRGTIPNGLTEAEVDFITEAAELKKGDRVLDLMCGYGRHALELGRRGINVEAVDNLGYYINEIREITEREILPVTAVESDAVDMQLDGRFKAAICMGNSFAFFNRTDALSILRNISDHLTNDGVLIINSWMIAEIAIRHFKNKDWHEAGEYKCVLDYTFCFNPSRIESEQTIISKEGLAETVSGIDYIYSLNELEEMFNSCGLFTTDIFSTPRKRKFNIGDGQIYIVAKKANN